MEVRRALARDWLRLNGRAARNAAIAMRSDAQRALEREEALRALQVTAPTVLTVPNVPNVPNVFRRAQ
jgi:LmbE family N-acetylglucosaminyl deacetylase